MKVTSVLPLLPVLASASPVFQVGTIHKDAAPVISSTNAKHIEDQYIVVFKEHVSNSGAASHHDWVNSLHVTAENARTELRKRSQFPLLDKAFSGLKHVFNITDGMVGYTGHFDEDVLEDIRRNPDVKYIEKDSVVHISSDEGHLEGNAPWGLARISHRDSLSFGTYNKYLYPHHDGEGVDVYVIDTGINTKHVDFEGRAHWGKTIPTDDEDVDGHGHGTHCAGTVGGKKYGVAKKANIYAVKVLRSNGSGSMSDVVKGVEFAVESHLKKVESAKSGKDKKFKGSTANMSLGGGKSTTLDLAVNAAVDAGVHFAVAAGNDNQDSCKYSPAAAEKAVTVGASTFSDARADFSNYGTCNDIFAPGLNILSTWIGSEYATNTISGTSMASPHIAGLLALFLSLQPSSDSAFALAEISPKKLKKHLISVSTSGALSNVGANTKNVLAWNGGGSSNYTEIIEKGGYTMSKDASSVLPIDEIKEEIVEIEHVGVEKIQEMKGRIESITRHLKDVMFEEVAEITEEIHELEALVEDN